MSRLTLSITKPTVGSTAGTAYATQINTALDDIVSAVSTAVVPSEIDMSADLDFQSAEGTKYGAVNVQSIGFVDRGGDVSTNYSIYFKSGDLFVYGGSGNAIQMTSGGSINVAAANGITGSGYGANSVEINWDSANTKYRMRSGSGTNAFADVECGDIRLNDGAGYYHTVNADAELSADVTINLPAPTSSGTEMLSIDNSGVIKDAVSAPPDEIRHGDIVKNIPFYNGGPYQSNEGANLYARGSTGVNLNGSRWRLGIPFIVGDRIKTVTIYYQRASGECVFTLYEVDGGTNTTLSTSTINTGTSRTTLVLNPTDTTITSTMMIAIDSDCVTTTGNFTVEYVAVTYDHP